MRRRYLSTLLLLLFVLSSCKEGANETGTFASPVQSTSPLRPEAVEATVAPPPQPQAGKATVTGRVMSRSTGAPIVNVAVRLAEVYRQGDEGAFVLDDALSPGSTTSEYGRFTIENVEAREYVIVVGNVSISYEIVPDLSGKARVWDVQADQVLDVGDLKVRLGP